MDTSGPYALVKAHTIFPESAHPHDTQVTRTLYTSHKWLTSTFYARTLCAQFTRHVQYLQRILDARTIFTESAHPHDTQVTRTLYTLLRLLTSTVYVPTLRAQFTRHVQDLQAYFTRVQFTSPPTRTINASKLRIQSTRPTYAYNLRLSLARTRYNRCQQIMCTTYVPNLRVQSTS